MDGEPLGEIGCRSPDRHPGAVVEGVEDIHREAFRVPGRGESRKDQGSGLRVLCRSRREVELGVMHPDADSLVDGARVDIHDHEHDAAVLKDFRDASAGIASRERNRRGVRGTPTFIDPTLRRRRLRADRVDEADVESTVLQMGHGQFDASYMGKREDAAVA